MGCHTWFNAPSKYSIEDLREIWCKQQEKWIERWTEVVTNPNDKSRLSIYADAEQSWMEWRLSVYIRQLRMVRNGNIKQAFVQNINRATDEGQLYKIKDGLVYCETPDCPHDLFRIGSYPEDVLRSLQETERFIETHNIQDVLWDKLNKFWNDYPNGFIYFG